MWDEADIVGRVLRASTARLSVGCQPPIAAQNRTLPALGALVKAPGPADPGTPETVIYGMVYNVAIEDDLFVRQLVAAGVEDEEYIADQRQRRQVPVVVEVLLVGFGSPAVVETRYFLPPRPPGTLDKVYACTSAEVVRFTARHDWMRTALGATASDVAADALLPAALRTAALARPPDQRHPYLVGAGRELARLLALEPMRLDGMLQQLRELVL
jgi:hypothetical protein